MSDHVGCAKEMDETVTKFTKRTIWKLPMTERMTVLQAWDFFLSENRLQTTNFWRKKESLVQDLVLLCEVTVIKIMNLKHHTTPGFFLSSFLESKRNLRQLLSHEGMCVGYVLLQ